MSIEAMKLALEALENYTNVVSSVNDPNSWTPEVKDEGKPARKAITALRQAIEQAQNQEHGIQVFFELDLQTGKAWQSAKVKRIQQENGDTCVYLDHWLEPKEPPQHALMAEHWKAEYDKLKAQRQPLTDWTSVDERLPDAGGYYLVTVATDEGPHVDVLLFNEKRKHWEHEGEPTFCHSYYFEPTHWAHRPEAAHGIYAPTELKGEA